MCQVTLHLKKIGMFDSQQYPLNIYSISSIIWSINRKVSLQREHKSRWWISHSFIKSGFFGMQQFSFNPAGKFSLKELKERIRKPSGLSLNPLFKKECHLLSNKLESMDICLRVNDTLILELKVLLWIWISLTWN